MEKTIEQMNVFELVELYMDTYDVNEETAWRMVDMDRNPDYNADDYDAE